MLRASSSLSARSATAPLSSVSSSVRARAPTVAAAATSKQRQDLCSSIAARVASSDNASTSSTSSFSSSSFATHTRSPAVNFAVLVAAVTGLVAVGGAAAPHAAAAALIDAAGWDASTMTPSSSSLAGLHHLHHLDHLLPQPAISDLADSEDFWSNLLRYVSFYFSVLLGTAATAARPVVAALRRSPASAAGVVVVALVLGIFVTKTVGAMLGVDDGSPDDLSAFLNSNME
jgi:hypothetical protein